MTSSIIKHSLAICGRDTSISLEDAFWTGLRQIAGARDVSLSDLVTTIKTGQCPGNLSSAIRVFVLDYYRDRALQRSNAARKGLAA